MGRGKEDRGDPGTQGRVEGGWVPLGRHREPGGLKPPSSWPGDEGKAAAVSPVPAHGGAVGGATSGHQTPALPGLWLLDAGS